MFYFRHMLGNNGSGYVFQIFFIGRKKQTRGLIGIVGGPQFVILVMLTNRVFFDEVVLCHEKII